MITGARYCVSWEGAIHDVHAVVPYHYWFTVQDRVDLIKPVSNVSLSIRMYVRTSVRPSTKSSFDFNEIWHLGRG